MPIDENDLLEPEPDDTPPTKEPANNGRDRDGSDKDGAK